MIKEDREFIGEQVWLGLIVYSFSHNSFIMGAILLLILIFVHLK